eukprot:gene9614-1837_t
MSVVKEISQLYRNGAGRSRSLFVNRSSAIRIACSKGNSNGNSNGYGYGNDNGNGLNQVPFATCMTRTQDGSDDYDVNSDR